MNLDLSNLNLKERPTIVLETLDYTPIAIIGDAYSLSANIKYNEVSEIEFTVPHFADGHENSYFDDITSMRIVNVTTLGRFRLVRDTLLNVNCRIKPLTLLKGYIIYGIRLIMATPL